MSAAFFSSANNNENLPHCLQVDTPVFYSDETVHENRCPHFKRMLDYQKNHDLQTALPNLDFLVSQTDQMLGEGKKCSLLFLIISGINEIGEHHGTAAAHHAMRTCSKRILLTINSDEMAARIHGELFAVISHHHEPEYVAGLLWDGLTKPVEWHEESLYLQVAIGVVSGKHAPDTAEGLIQAGFATAKEGMSRNPLGGVHQFSPALRYEMDYQYQLATRLRGALASHSLSLRLQAKVRTIDGCLSGAEALARWQDSLLGDIPPSSFIPLAERNGSITDISAWMLHQALQQVAAWNERGLHLSVAVNMSAIDLHHPQLVPGIRDALAQYRCSPSQLVIELTESAVAQNPAYAIEKLHELKALGISLSLDDFGTGYSSLSYLQRFPFDTLKIDRSFIIDLPHSESATAIVRAIITLASSLRMSTVAEGVETLEQARLLSKLGVDELQGYLFSRPVLPEAFLDAAQSGDYTFSH